jgi:hypothetical protein
MLKLFWLIVILFKSAYYCKKTKIGFMRLISTIFNVILLGLSLSSCYKEESVALDEYDVTLTYYDTDFDFKSYKTFTVRDSVMLYSDYLTESQINGFYTQGVSNSVRQEIVNKFKSMGYSEVLESENPDFMINPTISLLEQTNVYYNWWWDYPGYWGWYGDWYYKNSTYYYPPYWGWYPGFTVSYYSYRTGSLVMEMVDGESVETYRTWLENGGPETNSEAPEIIFRWIAQIDGIVDESTNYNGERTQRGFNEAFNQSPYLQK